MDGHSGADPFGTVFWPGSLLGVRLLKERMSSIPIGSNILVLGCGTGVEAIGAASLSPTFSVRALDLNPLSLSLLERAATERFLSSQITTQRFDLTSADPLPLEGVDVVMACDILYNQELATEVGRRCYEILSRPNPPSLIVTDSQRFHGTDFLVEMNARLLVENPDHETVMWGDEKLNNVTSSGILVPDDQVYDILVRYISL
ncbi:hypothetical protein TrRE_jg8712 [Triparma retinervis]|uniref:Methyltransferase domain-containing protein n=1 Tax=Triparma retinervis TaxID=2557542 RepID=A0A9W6ZH64_9STRA|nr:hypothetical protein TrRE_jg8712 [Triparma retinervis]